ncbi:MAG: aminotransferase class I/II-fold pyridoxal phosphate-dependent enzyme [Gemmatimonadota bacterium]
MAGSAATDVAAVSFGNALADAQARSSRYPDVRPLTDRIAARFGVPAERVLVTAGADEALERACRAVLSRGKNAIVTDPTFEMLSRYVVLSGGELRQVQWPRGEFPVEAIVAASDDRTALVAVVTPNNPTGAVAALADIRRLHDALPAALLVLDCAYVEFADDDLTAAALALPRVLVARTLSKAWQLPGIRIGYALGAPEVISWMRVAGGPYSVSSPSVALAEAALDGDGAAREAAIARIRTNRSRLEAILRELGEDVTPSQASFVCVAGARARWLRDALAGLGIAARLLGTPERLRITVPADDVAFSRVERAIRTALRPEAILFDMDGVLADVSQSYREAMRLTAAAFGVTVTADEIRARKAGGNANNDWIVTTAMVNAAGVPATLESITTTFEQVYQGDGGTPGLRETERLIVPREWIAALAARYPLAIVTGRPRADAYRFLDRFGLRELFRAVVTLDDGPLKPDPHPVVAAMRALQVSRAWMIGDTPDNVASARAAGALPIGVIPPGEPVSGAFSSATPPPGTEALANDGSLTGALYGAGAARVFDTSTGISTCLP